MLRIVGLQRGDSPEREFILLQNQGSLRANLRGLAILSECSVSNGDLAKGAFVFSDEEQIPPGLFVLLSTGHGRPHWAKTKDGAHVYRAYMCRKQTVWSRMEGAFHVLSPQHSYQFRGELLTLR